MSMRPSISINWTSPLAFRGLQYGLFACFFISLHTEITLVSIRGEPDQVRRSATPDLHLHFLHVLHKGRFIFIIAHINIYMFTNSCISFSEKLKVLL